MDACDDNEVIEFAEGLLTGPRAAAAAAHVADCERCREVIAELVRSQTHVAARRDAPPDEPDVLPVELVRSYLRSDAPDRERAIAKISFGIALALLIADVSLTFVIGVGSPQSVGAVIRLGVVGVWVAYSGAL